MDCETRQDAELVAVVWQWKGLNRISDDEANEVTKDMGNKRITESLDNSDDNCNDDSSDGRDNDNANDLDWESPDDNEADISNPDYELDESAAAQEGVLYEFEEDSKVKLDEETTAGMRHILERVRQRNALFIRCVMELDGNTVKMRLTGNLRIQRLLQLV